MTLRTTDECDAFSVAAMRDGEPLRALVYEIRALRLMLREEIREAAWRLAESGQPRFVAHRPYDQEAVPERLIEAVEGKDVP